MSVSKRQIEDKQPTAKRRAKQQKSGWWIKTIHTLKSKVHLSDEEYRLMMDRLYGVDSSKRLNFSEAMDLIDRLKAYAENRPAPPLSDRGVWISPAQRRKIIALAKEIGMVCEDGSVNTKRLFGFIARQLDSEKSLDMLLVREASKVITGLDRIHKNKVRTEQAAINAEVENEK